MLLAVSLQYLNSIAYSNISSRYVAYSLMSRTVLKDLLLGTAVAGLGRSKNSAESKQRCVREDTAWASRPSLRGHGVLR